MQEENNEEMFNMWWERQKWVKDTKVNYIKFRTYWRKMKEHNMSDNSCYGVLTGCVSWNE